jgi:tight adherence protein C
MMLVLLLAVLTFGLAAFLAGEVATYPQRRRETSVRRASSYGRNRRGARHQEVAGFHDRVLGPAVRRLAATTLKLNPKASVETIGSKLIAAGLASRFTTTQFLALKTGLALAGVVVGIFFAAVAGPVSGLLFMPMLAITGFLIPDVMVTLSMRSRRERIRVELPDALDLLAVSVEAGLGLDGAITKLTEHMEGPLVEEFAMTLGEMRIGESRHVALRNMAERVPSRELAAFVRSVIQADQLGISLGRILRVQAADSRLRRQSAAEERAMKAPIKMLFPTVIFIFPAMFIVILGPALLNLAKYLGGA